MSFLRYDADGIHVRGRKKLINIASVSLGGATSFEVRPSRHQEEGHTISFNGGDVCTTEGLFQHHWQHRAVTHTPGTTRYNLTFEAVQCHHSKCPALIAKKPKAEPATAPPEKRLESPKVAVDAPSIDASNDDALNTVDGISESGSRLMTI